MYEQPAATVVYSKHCVCPYCSKLCKQVELSDGHNYVVDATPNTHGTVDIDGIKYTSHILTCPVRQKLRGD